VSSSDSYRCVIDRSKNLFTCFPQLIRTRSFRFKRFCVLWWSKTFKRYWFWPKIRRRIHMRFLIVGSKHFILLWNFSCQGIICKINLVIRFHNIIISWWRSFLSRHYFLNWRSFIIWQHWTLSLDLMMLRTKCIQSLFFFIKTSNHFIWRVISAKYIWFKYLRTSWSWWSWLNSLKFKLHELVFKH